MGRFLNYILSRRMNFSDVLLISRNGIKCIDKCRVGIYYGEQRIASVYSSF